MFRPTRFFLRRWLAYLWISLVLLTGFLGWASWKEPPTPAEGSPPSHPQEAAVGPASRQASPPLSEGAGAGLWLGLGWLLFLATTGLGIRWLYRPAPRRLRLPSPVSHPLSSLYLWPSLLPKELCEALIEEAERRTWTRDRHTQATQDQPLPSLPENGPRTEAFLKGTLLPFFSQITRVSPLGLQEAFVVKYDTTTQAKLGIHRDASILTASFALNDASEYQGGGTFFPLLGEVMRLEGAGDALLHCGKLRHGGTSTRSGTRYLLVCFLDASDDPAFDHPSIQTWDSQSPCDTEVLKCLYR